MLELLVDLACLARSLTRYTDFNYLRHMRNVQGIYLLYGINVKTLKCCLKVLMCECSYRCRHDS